MTVPIRLPLSAAASSRSSRARRIPSGLGCLLGEQDPRQGDVLVLAQVGQLVVGGQTLSSRPGQRLVDLAVRGEHPRVHGGHGCTFGE